MEDCLNRDQLERYARGQLDRTTVRHLKGHLASCARCKTAYDVLRRENKFAAGVKGILAASDSSPTQTETPRAFGGGAPTSTDISLLADESATIRTGPRERFPEIEGYQIKRVVGRGGMGVVYEAVQQKLNRPVALKFLPALVSSAHPELVTRFKREAAAAARLHHTNIIPIYDFGESPDGYYYAMELISGQPLSAVIKRLAGMDIHLATSGSLAAILTEPDVFTRTGAGNGTAAGEPPSTVSGSSTGAKGRVYYRQAARWMADAAEALHYAHLQGMIHRDIKPGNLMLCTDGRIMILDFGLVKTTDEHSVTATGSLVGTYRYMSPEQVGAKRITLDSRTDVYSLGATMYELLTFQPALPATEQSELLSQILFKEPTICLKAMEKSPSARYQTAKAMATDLNSYLQDLAIVARRPSFVRRTGKFVRRRRLEAITALALVFLAVAALLGWRYNMETRRREIDGLVKGGVEHWQQYEWTAAERDFQQALRSDPHDYRVLVNFANMCGDQYLVQKDRALLRKEEELLNRAIQVAPRRKEAWNARGVLYQVWLRPADAITAFEKVIALDPNYYAAWVNLGTTQAVQRDLAEAERCLLRGTECVGDKAEGVPPEARPYHVMAWRRLAAVQIYLGRSEAEHSLAVARRLSDSKDPPTLVLSAVYQLAQPGEAEATEAVDLAVSAAVVSQPSGTEGRDGDQSLPRAKRAVALGALRLRQWERAARAAEEALAAKDEPSYAHLVLAVAAGQRGDLVAAREHLRTAETTWPDELRHAPFHATDDGKSLWFDTAAELEALQAEARRLVGDASTQP
jgi:serine/threonine protein kinase/Tfp pilus assembly protein PilF